MKRRIFSALTALALCLSLCPTWALAAGETWYISPYEGDDITLEAGKKYVAKSEEAGGGVEELALPEGGPLPDAYLDYAEGILTVYGEVTIYGTLAMELTNIAAAVQLAVKNGGGALATLKVLGGDWSGLDLLDNTNTTLTLDPGVSLEVSSNTPSFLSARSTITIQYPEGSSETGSIKISNDNDQGPSIRNLTVKNAQSVEIVHNGTNSAILNMENCPDVKVSGSEISSRFGSKIKYGIKDSAVTVDGVTLTLDGEWLYDGDISSEVDPSFRDSCCYKAGNGVAYYSTSASASNPSYLDATLTLVDVTHDGFEYEPRDTSTTTIVAKGTNKIDQIAVLSNNTVTVESQDGGTLDTFVYFLSDNANIAYGNVSLPDLLLGKLTVASGATLTIPEGKALEIVDPAWLTVADGGAINNLGTITLKGNAASGDVSQAIKDLKLTGTGTVKVLEPNPADPDTPIEKIYDNDGNPVVPKVDLDFTKDDTASGDLDTDGYHWDKDTKTLQLKNANIGTLTLPGNVAVTVELAGTSTLENLSIGTQGGYSQKMNVTVSGTGNLTVKDFISNGTDGDSFTVAKGATVTAEEGISIGASGGVNSTVTVNGTLVAKGGTGNAIYTGEVIVGETGKLTVSGYAGVVVNGVQSGSDFSGDFKTGAFTLKDGGSFTTIGECEGGNIVAASALTAGAIVLPEPNVNYLPPDCVLNADATKLLVKDSNPEEIYTKPFTIYHTHDWKWKYNDTGHWQECGTNHNDPCRDESGKPRKYNEGPHDFDASGICTVCKYSKNGGGGGGGGGGTVTPPRPTHQHRWAKDWTADIRYHWHECTASGCGLTSNRYKNGYGEHVYDHDLDDVCNECGYDRAAGHIHIWAEEWSQDGAHHWHACTVEGCILTDNSRMDGYGEHTYDDGQDAVCNDCGYEREIEPPKPVHTHSWAEEWSHDGTHHWHECTAEGCGLTENSQKDGYGEHRYDGDQDAVCNDCGYEREVVTPPEPVHTHKWAEGWSHDGTHHWHECTAEGCGLTGNSQKEGYGAHAYRNSQDAVCNICGYERAVEPPSTRPTASRGGGGSGTVNAYAITIEESEHGRVASNRSRANRNDTVTLTAIPGGGYVLDTLSVTSSRGGNIELTALDGGKYTFTMPGSSVTVKAAFTLLPGGGAGPCTGGADCPSRGFTDLGGSSAWYHEAVDFALRNGLMSGYSNGTFVPNGHLSRAMLAQILYNRAGKPAVTGGSVFADVADGQPYAPAIAWAAANGIISGYGNGLFGPNDNVTREQLAVILWRYAGSPAATAKELHFADADAAGRYAMEALHWAVGNGILNGYGDGRLNPKGLVTRAQAAQMLKNYLEG